MTWPAPSGKITMVLVAVQTPPGRDVSATYFGIDVLHPSCISGNKVLDVSCRSLVCFARRCTPMNAGRAMLARMAMIAITISNSIKVNAEEIFVFIYVFVTECRVLSQYPWKKSTVIFNYFMGEPRNRRLHGLRGYKRIRIKRIDRG